MQLHCQENKMEELFTCGICKKSYTAYQVDYEMKAAGYHPELGFICESCADTLPKESKLEIHLKGQ